MTDAAAGGRPLVRYEARAMGSPLRLTVREAATGDDPDRWWRVVVDEFEAAEAAMSRFRETSELTAANRLAGSGTTIRPSVRLRRALAAADRARRVTDGRFDPRVLGDLERLGYRGAPIGDGQTVARDAGDLPPPGPVIRRLDRDRLTLDRAVDLGGIGKGLTLRWAAARLTADGLHDFLLEAGGDLVAAGVGPEAGRWQLGIEDPDSGAEPLAVLAVTDLAVATSSTRVHRWTDAGRPVHHLLDPRTGEPADARLASVTVAAPDPAWAEVWSKVLFLGGRGRIAGEARARGLAAWWVGDDGTLEMTAAARPITIWVAAEAGLRA